MNTLAARIYKSPADERPDRLRRLLGVYDAALQGCVRRDTPAVAAALDALDTTLDYGACPELALALHLLYAHCRDLCDASRHDDAGQFLASLRAAWIARGAALEI